MLSSTQDIYSKLINCICATNPHCTSPVAIFDVDLTEFFASSTNYSVAYVVPGSTAGCSSIDSLLQSTLECFYLGSNCFSILMNYIQNIYNWNVEDPLWPNIQPFLYNSTLSNFPPNSSISLITKNIMIEHWNPSYSYKHFYDLCAPSYCTYSERTRTRTITGAITALVSMLGGLVVSLRLITPHLVKLFNRLLSKKVKKQEQQLQLGNCYADI